MWYFGGGRWDRDGREKDLSEGDHVLVFCLEPDFLASSMSCAMVAWSRFGVVEAAFESRWDGRMVGLGAGGCALSASVTASAAARSAAREGEVEDEAEGEGSVGVVCGVVVDGFWGPRSLVAVEKRRNWWLACLGTGAANGLSRGKSDDVDGMVGVGWRRCGRSPGDEGSRRPKE